MRFKGLIIITALASARSMTLPFIRGAGDGGPGDPPDAWLMPLIGDAAVGIAAIAVTAALLRYRSPAVWAVAVSFHSIAGFDALAALIVDLTTPWPDFFMLELFGRSMFVAAAAMHGAALVLLGSAEVRARFGFIGGAPPQSVPTAVSS